MSIKILSEVVGFKRGCLYKNKKTGAVYLCHGNYLSYGVENVILTFNVNLFNPLDFQEEVIF